MGTLAGALEQLSTVTFDCMVMDLSLPDGSGYDLLEHMAGNDDVGFPPVIVTPAARSAARKSSACAAIPRASSSGCARSPERLLDEVTLFLHSVEASLPTDQQRLLREARRRDTVLDGRTVLLAEDDVRNIFAPSSVLEPLGVTLEIARNGQEAVDRLAEREVDLVLMDIMMPEKDGLAAMREIRAQRHLQDLPIIALTAKAMPDDRERCLQAGANDYIAADRRRQAGVAVPGLVLAAMNEQALFDLELKVLLEALYQRYHYDFRSYAVSSLRRRIRQAMQRYECERLVDLQHRLLHERTCSRRRCSSSPCRCRRCSVTRPISVSCANRWCCAPIRR